MRRQRPFNIGAYVRRIQRLMRDAQLLSLRQRARLIHHAAQRHQAPVQIVSDLRAGNAQHAKHDARGAV